MSALLTIRQSARRFEARAEGAQAFASLIREKA
jgi:hypothetical protein